MPDSEVLIVRGKYGIDPIVEQEASCVRNHDRERTILIGAIEKIAKIFQKQMAQGDFVLDNDSRLVEEFCTLIELCLQHGWKGKDGNNVRVFHGSINYILRQKLLLDSFRKLR